jgi:hypothetical protein
MNSSWKKLRTAVRFLAMAKGPSTAAAKEDISEQLRQGRYVCLRVLHAMQPFRH